MEKEKGFWALPTHNEQFLMILEGPHETEKCVQYIEKSSYDKLKKHAEKMADGGQSCPNCNNLGWYEGESCNGELEQVQCEWCDTTPDSVFNIRQNYQKDFPEETK